MKDLKGKSIVVKVFFYLIYPLIWFIDQIEQTVDLIVEELYAEI